MQHLNSLILGGIPLLKQIEIDPRSTTLMKYYTKVILDNVEAVQRSVIAPTL